MEEVIRNVADIDTADRRALEHVIGKPLAENQQLVITVVNLRPADANTSPTPSDSVPDWWNIYEGLSDE
ncbi:MAG TPA: hypothetical protein VG099_02010, partial [Gemmataceae bacterium]|nr:hypothetical protein [Gemmataceae bacterium]